MLFSALHPSPSCAAIVLSAGRGTRMKSDTKKQYIEVLGKPIIVYALEAFQECDAVEEIVLVTGAEDLLYAQDLVKAFGLRKVKTIVPGGERRQDSVLCGLKAVSETIQLVAVHDGARPLIQPEDIERVIADANDCGAATLGVKVKDTMKTVDGNSVAVNAVDREMLRSIQTPQVFRKSLLEQGYDNAIAKKLEFTDDTAVVEAIGASVKVTEGNYSNIKITTPEDLLYMQAVVESIGNR